MKAAMLREPMALGSTQAPGFTVTAALLRVAQLMLLHMTSLTYTRSVTACPAAVGPLGRVCWRVLAPEKS